MRRWQPECSLLLAAALLLPLTGTAADEVPENMQLEPFRLEFEINVFGLSGDSIIELERTGNPDEYIYKSSTQAKGLAKLVRPDAASESSLLTIRGEQIFPEEYRVDSGTGDPLENSYAKFDWNLGLAYSNHQEERADVPIEDGVMDRFSADLQVIMDLRNGKQPDEYDMVHRNQVKTYQFYLEGEERVKTPAGTFDTVKYLRQRKGSSRAAYIWYAAELDYQPVKVVQLKEGKKRGTLLLKAYRPGTPD